MLTWTTTADNIVAPMSKAHRHPRRGMRHAWLVGACAAAGLSHARLPTAPDAGQSWKG